MKPTYEELEELVAVMLPCLQALSDSDECHRRRHDVITLNFLLMRIYGRDFEGCWTRALCDAANRIHQLQGNTRAFEPDTESPGYNKGTLVRFECRGEESRHVRVGTTEEGKRASKDDGCT